RDVRDAVEVAAVQRADDVGMRERCRDAHLPLEAARRGRVGVAADAEQLEGDLAAEALVARTMHHAHAAAAQFVQQRVRTQGVRWWGQGPSSLYGRRQRGNCPVPSAVHEELLR